MSASAITVAGLPCPGLPQITGCPYNQVLGHSSNWLYGDTDGAFDVLMPLIRCHSGRQFSVTTVATGRVTIPDTWVTLLSLQCRRSL